MTHSNGSAEYILRLFVAGRAPSSVRALVNLRRICDEHLKGRSVKVEIIDVLLEPGHAEAERVSLTPTLCKEQPLPRQRIVGDLSQTEIVLQGLDLMGDFWATQEESEHE